MYGHQLYLNPIEKRVEYLNKEIRSSRYESLESLAEELFIDIVDLKKELKLGGYFYIQDLNQFKRIEVEKAGEDK